VLEQALFVVPATSIATQRQQNEHDNTKHNNDGHSKSRDCSPARDREFDPLTGLLLLANAHLTYAQSP
jgi:hypothetical protein